MTRAHRRGFSFVDVLVGTAILSVLLASVLALGSQNIASQDEQVDRSLAQGLCLDVLEQFRAARPSPAGGPVAQQVSVPVGSAGRLFDSAYLQQVATMRLSVAPKVEVVVADSRTGLMSVTVSVDWRSRRGQNRTVRLTRYFLPGQA
jgi:type II secretory pathway pseudopilin PulG